MTFAAISMLLFFVGMIFVGVPVALGMILSAGLYLIYASGTGVIDILTQRVYSGITPFPLTAIPLFILAASVLNRSGLTESLFKLANVIFGRFRGGLAQANIGASVFFGGISGSAVADAAGLGSIEIEGMAKSGYSKSFAAAVTASSACLAPIIPPSITLIIYGSMTGVSVGGLFLAGIVPGLVLAIAMMIVVSVLARLRKYGTCLSHSFTEFRDLLIFCLPALGMPLIVVIGIGFGWLTSTEVAFVAAIYCIFVSIVFDKTMSFKIMLECLQETVVLTGSIMFLIGCAGLFAWVLTFQGVPQYVAEAIVGISDSKTIFLIIVACAMIFLGLFMESIAALILVTPIFFPMLQTFDVDPVFFGVFLVFLLSFGLITPPLGMCLFVVSRIARVHVFEVVRECLPFYGAFLVVIAAMIAYPDWVIVLGQ
jgi:C4-dicarboxylate transporter DctM subunit